MRGESEKIWEFLEFPKKKSKKYSDAIRLT